ncbi:MAG TPA: hypothetical protein VGG86_04740 [Roseiarcus sp.]
MAESDWSTPSEEISIERDGVTYTGTFQTERKMIRVSYGFDSETAQLGGMPPRAWAVQLLSELVRKASTDKAG